MPKLLDLSPEILSTIIDFVGFPQMFQLRQVCAEFRNLIDDLRPNPKLTSLSMAVLPDERIHFSCRQNSKKYSIEYSKSNLNQFFKDLETILISQRSPILKRIKIEDQSEMPGFNENIAKYLKSRSTPLKVKLIVIAAKNHAQIYSVLSYLEPKTLVEIFINGPKALELNEVVKLEQWKNASNLTIYGSLVDIPLSSFTHFSNVYVNFLKTVNFEELDELKKALLTSQTPEMKIIVRYTEMIGEEEWSQSLGPTRWNKESQWFYQFENSTNGLFIQFQSDYRYVEFQILDKNSL